MTFTIEQLEKMIVDTTQGPWHIDQAYRGEVQKTGALTIASCWAGVHESAKCEITGVNDCSLDEAAANAALIASAPTLATAHIAALKRVAELEALVTTLDPDAFDKFSAACDSSEPAAPFLSIGASK